MVAFYLYCKYLRWVFVSLIAKTIDSIIKIVEGDKIDIELLSYFIKRSTPNKNSRLKIG